MDEHDESLETGLAAGMDIAPAMTISAQDDKPPKRKAGCSPVLAIVAGLLVIGWLWQ